MEAVRCSVDCWADFGELLSGRVVHTGTEVLLTTGTSDLLVFSGQEKRVKSILQFDSPVTSLAVSDKNRLYALCQSHGLYCTSFPQECSSQSVSAQKCDSSVSTISRDSIVIEDGKMQAFILVEGILVTVSLQESFWSFDLYKVPNCSTGATVYRKHASVHVSQNTVGARIGSAPVLASVYPSKDSSFKGRTCQGHYLLEPLLFRLLFGVDAALVHSPVILCGLPDGRLFFFPLLLPSWGEQKPRIRMLHSLEQPVTFMGTSVIGEQGPQCLVIVGQMGRILLIRASQTSSDGKAADCGFIEQTVRGPVVCACVNGEHLFYSTSTTLLALPLSKTAASSAFSSLTAAEGERESIRQEKPALLSQSAVCLSVSRVIALAEPSVTPTGHVQLLLLSHSGRLLQVTLPQESDKDSVSRLTSSKVGQTVKDLLAGIGNVWERATSVKLQLQLKNNVLKRLNQVINICSLFLTYQKSSQEGKDCKPPISCHGVAKWSTLLQKEALVLTCTLENLSAYVLDQGWTLCIEVQSPYSLTAEGTSKTYSFALKKLDCGQKMEVNLPLESRGEEFVPVKIQCFLVYSLQSLLHKEECRNFSASEIPVSHFLEDKSCISLTLNTLTLDWLDCLRIGQPASHSEIPKQNSVWEATCIFLRSRRIHTEEQPMPKADHHVVAIRISFDLLKTVLGFRACSSAVLCVSVLNWLLFGMFETGGQKFVESAVVCAHGPDRQPVRLLTKEVILSDVNAEGPLSVVEVQVQSSSMAAVFGLHHAVLRRVQGLLKDAPVKCANPGQLKGQRLCEAVRHAESLYKDLQDSQSSAAFGGVMKTRTSESLFDLYLQLRENPLVIL
ncbi:hypothetical protein SRHO_G00157600 [Serrasalmus rhombeus]